MDDNSSTTTLTRQCNFDFLIMHVVPIQGIKSVVQEEELLTINVQPGWKKGTKIKFEGKGNET
ncbi:DNAJ family B protein, putative [Medicago truncatula]|uniref:DNAJ family B protein, putative n=1 Tax=Medicago truncatula TaxID=3880 RepID=G7J8Z6_MEDTR|nr:DNAJ family B protein, putative [Medicago truncatula]